jgi:hypothetical protein
MSRPPSGKPFRSHARLKASDLNAIRRELADRPSLDLAAKRIKIESPSWLGQITFDGPPVSQQDPNDPPPPSQVPPVFMPDFVDSRYWVREIVGVAEKITEGPTGPPMARPSDAAIWHPANDYDLAGSLLEITGGRSAWLDCINLAEFESGTHCLPAGTLVRVHPFTASTGLQWNVFDGPETVTLEVAIEKVITNTGDAANQREQDLLAYFGSWFKCRRLKRPNAGNPSIAVVDMSFWLVCLPQTGIDASMFKNGAAQIYGLPDPDPAVFLATNAARGLTLFHQLCNTALIPPPPIDSLCPPAAI